VIRRDLANARTRTFDLVVIGGGIYGAALLQQASRHGLTTCLCEAVDFGGGTSWNSLRILHGGLRYLQTLDLRRFFQSVSARRWMAHAFPGLVRPLRCVMPLYGDGLKRRSIMRLALLVNDALSRGRNRGLSDAVQLSGSDVLDAATTRRDYPHLRADRLEGAGIWQDYLMLSSERILIELLRDACTQGAVALNYARVADILVEAGRVHGVAVEDELSSERLTVRARAVVNCTGPWVSALAQRRGAVPEELFRPSLAFNLLLDARLPGEAALAVSAPQPKAQVLFLIPQKHGVLAGTMHLPCPAEATGGQPTSEELDQCLAQLRAAVPDFDVNRASVRRVFAGLLPARAVGTAELAKREVLLDHGQSGGPKGFYSVSGVKYTTAHDVGAQALRLMGVKVTGSDDGAELQTSSVTPLLTDAERLWSDDTSTVRDALVKTADEEAVQSLDDLILRRTNWATTEVDLERVRHRVRELAGTRLNLSISQSRDTGSGSPSLSGEAR
jgi:glycerol-3-phosphate dehydrogenase